MYTTLHDLPALQLVELVFPSGTKRMGGYKRTGNPRYPCQPGGGGGGRGPASGSAVEGQSDSSSELP